MSCAGTEPGFDDNMWDVATRRALSEDDLLLKVKYEEVDGG